MKNVQVIDGADNCTYSVYAFTENEFSIIFPEPGQTIEFIEDAERRLGPEILDHVLTDVWTRLIKKPEVFGIHGTLFYELEHKKQFYPTKSECDVAEPPHSPGSVAEIKDGGR